MKPPVTKVSIKNAEFNAKKDLFKQRILNSPCFVPNYEETWVDKSMSWFGVSTLTYKTISHQDNSVNVPMPDSSLLRAKQVGIQFNTDQKQLILKWIELARIIYNITVLYFKHNKLCGFGRVRPIIKKLYSTKLAMLVKSSKMPVHIQDNAINDVIKAHKSAQGLLKAKMINHYKIRYKKQSKPNQTIVIESGDFNKTNSFYATSLNESALKKFMYEHRDCSPKVLAKLKKDKKNELCNYNTSEPITNIQHDVRLTYNQLKNKFLLRVPTERIETILKPKLQSCGIDPGNITNLTIYSQEGTCYKIANRAKNNKLYELTKKKLLAKKLLTKHKQSKYKRLFKRVSEKMQNLTKELHYKSALFICRTFDNIYLGKLSTKGITSRKNKMSSLEKEFTYALSHDKFRNILTNKAQEYRRNLFIVDESYTSKACGCCGKLTNVGLSRVYNCSSCNSKLDRDLNAARNILIKHLH